MDPSANFRRVYITACLLLLVLCGGRGYMALGDLSYFFVAGSDFVDASQTPTSVFVQNGQGYDGQFFYRYALDPFDFSKTNYGVTVDLVPYRIQRVGYPLLTWFVSWGGHAQLVPFALLLVNLLAFFGVIHITGKLVKLFGSGDNTGYAPLILCGIYMSLARDLSEVVELYFFLSAIYYLFTEKLILFVVYATCCLLTRETAIMAIAPASVAVAWTKFRAKNLGVRHFMVFIPVLIMIAWKYAISLKAGSIPTNTSLRVFGWPFEGMIDGFSGNLKFNSTKNILQFFFWIAYFAWQVWLIRLVFLALFKSGTNIPGMAMPIMKAIFFTWFCFAILLSVAIYIDDWSFVRVFSLWNMTGLLILMARKKEIPSLFLKGSALLVLFTVFRLIIRP